MIESTAVVEALTIEEYTSLKEKDGQSSLARRSRGSSPSTACAVVLGGRTWGLVRASSNKPSLVGRRREPCVGGQHARDVQGTSTRGFRSIPKWRLRSEDLTSQLNASYSIRPAVIAMKGRRTPASAA